MAGLPVYLRVRNGNEMLDRSERRGSMSWYSDGEYFDEYDPPYCERCNGGTSYEECQACVRRHEEDAEDD